MLIFSFGSGFKMESTSAEYRKLIKSQITYAKSKGIEVGGYDLIDLDRGSPDPAAGDFAARDSTGKATGNACFASGWYDDIHNKIMGFINDTGLSMVEVDGPYGGQAYKRNHMRDVFRKSYGRNDHFACFL